MQPAETVGPPAGLDPTVTYRENRIEADCETLDGMRKVGHVGGFEIFCDESVRVGGEGTAPSPLGYFTAAIGF